MTAGMHRFDIRGPRISAEASERLKELAYVNKLSPCEVVSRLILGQSLHGVDNALTFQRRERLSDSEMMAFQELQQ